MHLTDMRKILIAITLCILCSCHIYSPGPDKRLEGMLSGALTGAGTGAVTGYQLSAGAGPGAAVGAGFGALAGAIHGAIKDAQEEQNRILRAKIEEEQRVSFAQGVLSSFVDKRIHKHPSREIYPADIFFYGDETSLTPEGRAIVKEIAKLNKERFPWSRIVVASYVKSKSKKSPYAKDLARERAREIGQVLTVSGINPRRIEPQAIIVPEEIYYDKAERWDRYAQAIEIILLDANG